MESFFYQLQASRVVTLSNTNLTILCHLQNPLFRGVHMLKRLPNLTLKNLPCVCFWLCGRAIISEGVWNILLNLPSFPKIVHFCLEFEICGEDPTVLNAKCWISFLLFGFLFCLRRQFLSQRADNLKGRQYAAV